MLILIQLRNPDQGARKLTKSSIVKLSPVEKVVAVHFVDDLYTEV